ncbi:DUF1499 domain-containing protein [filamentous cyanobacterium LEGE 11480]|uniref:DUF1499 domain-containing protein n=1 Tax=Romeriopsis navalis LEGE 11480 TaxID=2777977 RepID=A0A928VRJ4_9CYAN|nr:DUF1499 domain-containing protein [Romeriopsis navalis]MBE9031270.1 DUF1499 domain-containing protein [Romeriopsis navalis LEGE 11480]
MMRTLMSIGLAIVMWLSVMSPVSAAMFSFAGERPTNLGVNEGRLAACPATPNCVSSQAKDDHQIAPLAYVGSGPETMAKIKQAIVELPGSEIITDSGNYIYAEFTSSLLGFVDDVEFYCDDAVGAVQVRSAARLGESDLGVNAKRVAEIRAML